MVTIVDKLTNIGICMLPEDINAQVVLERCLKYNGYAVLTHKDMSGKLYNPETKQWIKTDAERMSQIEDMLLYIISN